VRPVSHYAHTHSHPSSVRPPAFSLNPLRLLTALSMLIPLLWLSSSEKSGLQKSQEVQRTGIGYFHEQ
jgi:hypothetical protein